MHQSEIVTSQSPRLMTTYREIDTDWSVVVRCLHVAACRLDFAVELSSQEYGQALHAAVRVDAEHAEGTSDAVSMCQDIKGTGVEIWYKM